MTRLLDIIVPGVNNYELTTTAKHFKNVSEKQKEKVTTPKESSLPPTFRNSNLTLPNSVMSPKKGGHARINSISRGLSSLST